MKLRALYRRIAALPEAAQEEVARLKERLEAQAPPRSDLPTLDEPFIGMWADRIALADSTGWVRQIRRREWEARG